MLDFLSADMKEIDSISDFKSAIDSWKLNSAYAIFEKPMYKIFDICSINISFKKSFFDYNKCFILENFNLYTNKEIG